MRVSIILSITLSSESVTKLLALEERINNNLNKLLNNILQRKDRLSILFIYRFIILNIISKVDIIEFT